MVCGVLMKSVWLILQANYTYIKKNSVAKQRCCIYYTVFFLLRCLAIYFLFKGQRTIKSVFWYIDLVKRICYSKIKILPLELSFCTFAFNLQGSEMKSEARISFWKNIPSVASAVILTALHRWKHMNRKPEKQDINTISLMEKITIRLCLKD